MPRSGGLPLLLLVFFLATSLSQTDAGSLVQPPICSSIAVGAAQVQFPFCRVAPSPGKPGKHDITLSLTATTSPAQVGGYLVAATDNYNGGYLSPIVEMNSGDTFKVRLVNALSSFANMDAMHHMGADAKETSSTNLHTHGLIVSPKNAGADLPQNGDNIFVKLDRGQSLDYSIEIPTELPASLLDGTVGFIAHPNGLYWYHSHEHGLSSTQVGGGMSSLLSIGEPKSNLVDVDPTKTPELRDRTDVSYVILRDMQILSDTAPEKADGHSAATWVNPADTRVCEPGADGVVVPPLQQREGYCQSPKDKRKIWLFTVNGERYPTIRIPNRRNGLLRVANLSASAVYLLSFLDVAGAAVPFYVISVDGVVPGTPVSPSVGAGQSAAARTQTDLLLMPAARAEIFLGNDDGDGTERQLVFRSAGLNTASPGKAGGDPWPEIKLASVVLEGAPVAQASATRLGLNPPRATLHSSTQADTTAEAPPPPELAPVSLPAGCVRDIDKTKREHRRIMFSGPDQGKWAITTEIVYPIDKDKLQDYKRGFRVDAESSLEFTSFDDYIKGGTIDWDGALGAPRHTCISLKTGHGQLWELENPTTELHNFHIHQSKFRLATDEELRAYGIDPDSTRGHQHLVHAMLSGLPAEGSKVWHDTLPVWPSIPVFIIINFDAEEQLGRYVFHCHILAHEDNGLMAPIEVIR